MYTYDESCARVHGMACMPPARRRDMRAAQPRACVQVLKYIKKIHIKISVYI